MATSVDLDEIEEFEDSPADLEVKIKKLTHLVGESKHLVVFTGAGISTSASIPDYRGPNGVWTLKAQGKKPKAGRSFDDAIPTPCHMTLKELQDRDLLKYVVSQNVDGLHRRSGILKERISELHGNCYLAVCWTCNCEQLRHQTVRQKPNPLNGKCKSCLKRVPHFCHCILSDKCINCKTQMRDSIIHFGENLPEKALDLAYKNGKKADVMIVFGSSLRVSPANAIPEETVEKGGKLVIVNLQKTPLDGSAHLRIFAKTDLVCEMLMKELAIPIPQFIPHRIIYIGNKHEQQASQLPTPEQEAATPVKTKHRWTVYLRGELGTDLTPFVAHVAFHLHPTFTPPLVTVKTPPYEVTKIGWGVFQVKIVVVLNNGMVSEYNHELDFSQEDTYTKHTLYLQQTVSDEVEEGVKHISI